MDQVAAAIALVVGLLIGAGIAWLLLRERARMAFERGKTEGEAARAALAARLAERDQQTGEMRAEIDTLRSESARASAEAKEEAAARAAAAQTAVRVPDLERAVAEREETIRRLAAERGSLGAQLEEQRQAEAGKLALIEDAQRKLSDAFKALSAEALRQNNASFLELAKTSLEKFHDSAKTDLETRQTAIAQIVTPVKESLDKVDVKLGELEKARLGAYAALTEQVRGMLDGQNQLKAETANLVKALRAPVVRGRWGEIHLRRVVEMAGMIEHCDFEEQQTVETEDRRLRPDLVVRLPGRKNVVVDAKTPLAAYLDALEASNDEIRRVKLLHLTKRRAQCPKLADVEPRFD